MSNRRRDQLEAGGGFGDILEELSRDGHITQDQYVAGLALLADMQRWHGTSAGLVGDPSVKIDRSLTARTWPPGAGGDARALQAVGDVLKRLHGHERSTFNFLLTHRELTRGKLVDYGRSISGYKTAKTQRAAAVGRIGGLVSTLHEVMRNKPPARARSGSTLSPMRLLEA